MSLTTPPRNPFPKRNPCPKQWWPGALARTVTHAVVMARLVIGTCDYGPHAFVVQLRDMDSHLLLPGIETGDIGPKMVCSCGVLGTPFVTGRVRVCMWCGVLA